MLIKQVLPALLLCVSGLVAQTGKQFPLITGTTLAENKLTIPLKNDKYSVIAIAFHRDAEDELKIWLNPLYDTFIVKEGKGGAFDMADFYDVNFTFVPMIAGFKRVADEFKKGTDKHFWTYILDTEKTDIKALQKQLGVTDNKVPYFFVVGKDGFIKASEKGKYDQKKIARLEDVIE